MESEGKSEIGDDSAEGSAEQSFSNEKPMIPPRDKKEYPNEDSSACNSKMDGTDSQESLGPREDIKESTNSIELEKEESYNYALKEPDNGQDNYINDLNPVHASYDSAVSVLVDKPDPDNASKNAVSGVSSVLIGQFTLNSVKDDTDDQCAGTTAANSNAKGEFVEFRKDSIVVQTTEQTMSHKDTAVNISEVSRANVVAPPMINEDYTDIQSPEDNSSLIGPSDDRDDVSDAELDLTAEYIGSELRATEYAPNAQVSTINTLKEAKDDGEKSDIGSVPDDASALSKGPSEDLEAVSDDELPEQSHTKASVLAGTALIEGGEDVSSEDEDMPDETLNSKNSSLDVSEKVPLVHDNHEPVSPTALPDPESPSCLPEPVSPTALPDPVSPAALPVPVSPGNLPDPVSPTALPDSVSPGALPEPVSPEALVDPVSPAALPEPVSPTALADPVSPTPELAPLDAEPISDEEDNNDLADEEDGEAGEIKSPTEDITSPPSSPEHSKTMLGEVEPVSADDSNDTDGELPSGDEDDTKADTNLTERDEKFEAIDSDEDGVYNSSSKQSDQKKLKKEADYMESISEEETLDTGLNKPMDSMKISSSILTTSLPESIETNKTSDGVRMISAPNFNEHQVELDYEENEGDDNEVKPEESKIEVQEKEDGEDGELEEGIGSDKDEGELSDDDCEEGEIKEPGSRKPFIKPMCRFFQRGHCTWGINCRFLHPGVNDKGNYQMIEIPGFQPTGIHARIGVPAPWMEQPPPVEEIEIPPPPLPDTPPPETAWERGLRIAKEQRKKASQRREQEPDFEEKRLNLSVDEERELNKENERAPRIVPKDPYYDQQAYEEDEYYKIPRDPWHTGHYENFEVRHHREPSFSPPYRERPPGPMPPMRYNRPYNSPPQPSVDKFGRDRMERREDYRPKPAPPPQAQHDDYPSTAKRPDEWIDPWRRQTARKDTKSPQRSKRKRSGSRKRNRRSVSDSSNSSRSASGSSSGSSRSSRSYSGSSGSSSRSRSPEPAPPGVDRHDRYNQSPTGRDQPRSAVSVRGRGGGGGYHNNYDRRGYHGGPGRPRGGGGDGGGYPHRGGFRGGGRGGGWGGPANHNFEGGRGRGDGYRRDMRERGGRGDGGGLVRPRAHPSPGRPLPYTRPRPRSASSRSSSSRSRSRSGSHSASRSRSHSPRGRSGRAGGPGGRGRYSSSRSSSGSSSSRSSSSSSAVSADSEHLYRDLGSPGKSPSRSGAVPPGAKRKRGVPSGHKDRQVPPGKNPTAGTAPSGSQRQPNSQQQASRQQVNLDSIPIPREPRDSRTELSRSRDSRDTRESRSSRDVSGASGGRSESRYASRNAPQPPVKAKDPLKVVGQKSNIKLTLLPKQQQPNLGSRPNPLDSPPHKRRISERDSPPSSVPPAKRLNLPVPQASALRIATEKAAKIHQRQEKIRQSPPPMPMPSSTAPSLLHHASGQGGSSSAALSQLSSSSSSRARAPISPQKQISSGQKFRGPEPSLAKTAPKMVAPPSGASAMQASTGAGANLASSAAGTGKVKKSTSSRREELLKQLKAVEDAIARKKTKLT